jgi:hypothetical protein
MPEPPIPPVLGMPWSLGSELPPLGGEPLGSAPELSLGAPDEPVLGAGLDVLPPGTEPVLVSLADEPVLPGAVVAPLGPEPVLGAVVAPLGLPPELDDPIPPEVACATITPPSGGACFGAGAVARANAKRMVDVMCASFTFLRRTWGHPENGTRDCARKAQPCGTPPAYVTLRIAGC